ncbi:MD-2-related lipid-recognition protein-like [Teleopsis dalmanni]|uniref:MD-2-related lipid-recognition protein-like n=1 Tax=Teleopsis dalmanni TaxID=139649 RepID=UPI0018CFCB4E|nr:MD-2-related lipid-recognition protein-like [Teleopsis dalmanni]
MHSSKIVLLKCLVLLTVLIFGLAEVVDYKLCPGSDHEECIINEVRINPCPQAAQHIACKLRRGKPSNMSFDYTPKFDSDSFEGSLTWVKSETEEPPLLGFDREACKYTTCPIRKDQPNNYEIIVPIQNKFPMGSYTIRWNLKAPSGKSCCFTTDIKLVR